MFHCITPDLYILFEMTLVTVGEVTAMTSYLTYEPHCDDVDCWYIRYVAESILCYKYFLMFQNHVTLCMIFSICGCTFIC